MRRLMMDIPDDILLALAMSEPDAAAALRMAAAVKLYEIGRLSSGAAAELAGVPRLLFLSRLADYEVDAFRLRPEDLLKEKRLA